MLDKGLVKLITDKLGDKVFKPGDTVFGECPTLKELFLALTLEGGEGDPCQVSETECYEYLLDYDNDYIWSGFRQLANATSLPQMFFYNLLREDPVTALATLNTKKED